MKYRLLAGWLIGSLLLLSGSGCQILHRYRPVVVLVRDAETKTPISGAEVGITYPLNYSWLGPSDCHEPTAGDGIARMQAAPFRDVGIVVTAAAPGYMPEEQFVSVKEVEALKPAHLFEAVERRPVTMVLELFSMASRPSVELVLPVGYRGMVKAEIKIDENASCPTGQRQFTYLVPATGVVQASVPPVFSHFPFPDFHARYADGPVLPTSAKEQEVGFWWLQSQGNVHTFLVGLESEYARFRPSTTEPTKAKRSGGGGGHGRGGGRGGKRGGNQPPADSSSGAANP